MKKLISSLLFVVATMLINTMSTSAVAVEGLSANAGVTNSYLWRGLEQTNGQPAVSGGIDFESNSGFYLGTWVSNADWAAGMTYELDLYGGYVGEINSLSYDVGFVHYAYPDSVDDLDFTEVNASISYGFFSFGYALLANAENIDFGDDGYIFLDADFSFASDIGLSLHVGKGTDDFYAGESFLEYGASVSKNNFTFGVSKTDLNDDDVKFIISYVASFDF